MASKKGPSLGGASKTKTRRERILEAAAAAPQQQQRLPDWTSRYILVPDEAEDISKSDAVLELLHPAAAAAFRRRIGNVLFPIQMAVIPHLLRLLELPFGSSEASDVCVHAATGEGKTLCYALPLVSHLFSSRVPLLRCVVLTPTRELAVQVTGVFNVLMDSRKQGSEQGRISFAGAEGASRVLRVVCLAGETTAASKRQKATAATGAAAAALGDAEAAAAAPADILVCTPGRFVDIAHVYIHHKKKGTQGLGPSFEALRWLVVDEADRLLKQSFHGWLEVSRLIAALREGPQKEAFMGIGCTRAPSVGGSFQGQWNDVNGLLHVPPVRKILFSATMTRNPRALHDLQLYRPLFFFCSPTGKAQMPSLLQQKFVLCKPERKPLVLMALLYQLANAAAADQGDLEPVEVEGVEDGGSTGVPPRGADRSRKRGLLRVVVFCGSRQAAHRLTRLLQLHFQSRER
ncbi:ATP-dependent RNA helicase DDX51 [Cyclospora cayetanensis]|uniref:ATP-dependent RNA helicase n=1 Tax=Cyclospora cayetanensis TaxID=88456 RepID=A0A6P6S189_9EIME|nr:ATP-dependent RNA helicase DDX51 [Cyclospora cayetanensis]